MNYPGATIEYSIGKLADRYMDLTGGHVYPVMDTPGTYSLFPKSADEEVTLKALYEHPHLGPAGKVILVVDGTQLARHLLVAKQLQEAGFSFVIAVTMSDLLRKNGIELDVSGLEAEFKTKVILIDGLLGGGLAELIKVVHALPATDKPRKLERWNDLVMSSSLLKAEALAQEAVRGSLEKGKDLSKVYEKTALIDQVLLHPILGLVIFFLIMWGLFTSIYSGAAPLMDLIDIGFGHLKDFVMGLTQGLAADFLGNGIVASFGSVLIFVPQIFILFMGIGILESSGYLARAATLIDRPFSKIGMSGRSFVPILSGFACAVPAVMATRNISSKRDRWITNFVIPLMTCSARLPVYALLLGFLFFNQPPWKAGLALAALYMGAVFVGGVAAGILNRVLAKNEKSFFMMELPIYRRPQVKVILRQALLRTNSYVRRAGPPIFLFAVLIWVGSTFPNYQMEDPERLQSSYLAQAGRWIEPVFEPMGVDWRVGVGLLSAFAAREVFVSSLAMMFNIAGDEEAQADGLLTAMGQATNQAGQPIFTAASVLGLLVFFMIALQCISTVGIQIKENDRTFAITQLVVFNVVAYVMAVIVVQGLRAVGIS